MIELTDWPYPNAVKGNQYQLQGLLVEMERDYMLANDALRTERDALAVENARLRAGYQRIRETFRDEKFSGVDVSNEAEFIAQRLLNWDELSKVTQEDMNVLLGLFKAQSHE